jgi:nucleotide-binding universal stress UspA family protein
MFKHLLVPLDGSPLSETALPAAWFLAKMLDARVTLLHLIERNAPAEVHHARHLRTADEATAYLDEVRQRAFPKTAHVESHVHTAEIDDVARSLADHAAELAVDLIVMCTHGRGDARRWLFGSNAQKVIALSTTPMLLIPPMPDQAVIAFHCDRIVVPLDGNVEHEQGLHTAADLAQVCHAAIHLVLVIPTLDKLKGEKAATGKLLPRTMTALLDLSQDSAEDYLRDHLIRLQAAGLTATAEIARGDAAVAIVAALKRAEADLMALGTHGKTGLDAFWSGSLTPTITERSPVPLLLVPIHLTT